MKSGWSNSEFSLAAPGSSIQHRRLSELASERASILADRTKFRLSGGQLCAPTASEVSQLRAPGAERGGDRAVSIC
jgi:hypothetical protein